MATSTSERPREGAGTCLPAVSSPGTRVGVVLLLALLLLAYAGPLRNLATRWANDADYSHGFLVPFFSAYLLWHRRKMAQDRSAGGWWFGAGLIILGGLARLAAIVLSEPLGEPVSMILCIMGIPVLLGGWAWLKWSWPSVFFLCFMVPIPGFINGIVSGPLQRIATDCSTWVLQTIGVPATAQGNVIWLTSGKIGVVEACSGLRMLVAFGAITFAAACLVQGAMWERIVILLSAVPIAIASNVIRIAATGLAHEKLGAEIADFIFHDLAGWLMMPLAVLLLAGLMYLFAVLFPSLPEGPQFTRPSTKPSSF